MPMPTTTRMSSPFRMAVTRPKSRSTYALPRADDLPSLDITLAELPTAVNQLGVKGAGQAGCMAAPQTIINAILDALAPFGIAHIDMPATPERVWRAIRSALAG